MKKQLEQIEGKVRDTVKDKFVIFFVFFIAFAAIGTLLLIKSFAYENEKIINYEEKSSIDYKVYLKENEFYETPYLGKDMIYVASLIDNITVDFDYNFEADEPVDLDMYYSIIGKLLITDPSGDKKYYEKEYTLVDKKKIEMRNSSSQQIKEPLKIDYNYYNDIVNDFRAAYGLSTDNKFVIYMQVDKNNKNSVDEVQLTNSNYMSFSVPLSEKSVNIKMTYNELDETSYIVNKADFVLSNIFTLVASVVSVALSVFFMIKCLRLYLSNREINHYDKYVKKVLREYDRLIVETSNFPDIKGLNVVEVDKFTEMLDVHDNLKVPVMYYVVKENEKCYFYIKHDNMLYLKTVEKSDFKDEK